MADSRPSLAPPRLSFERVGKSFPPSTRGAAAVEAIRDVSFEVHDGTVTALIGPSGCGKSTVLNMGSGLYQPTTGTVHVDGERVVEPNPHVAFMLQKDLLLPWRTIAENVQFGLEIRGIPREERLQRTASLLTKCHLDKFGEHYPHQISGGMRQRAALARTLAVDPTLLLLDEPFSALDAQTKIILQQDLATTLVSEARTAVLITHDLEEALLLSDRVLVMSARPGMIVEDIEVSLSGRGDPLARRGDRALGEMSAHLMSLLNIGVDTELEEI